MSMVVIFSQMASRIIEGMMVHEQLMNSYLFLSLPGYAACHEYHYREESDGYIRLCKYVSNHFDILVPSESKPNDPGIVPESWRNSSRSEITHAMRKEAMGAALSEWLNWEIATRDLYEKCYKEAIDSGYIPASEFIKSYILDVESEIVYCRNELLSKEAMDFDIVSILEEQESVKKLFQKKIKKIGDNADEDE